MASYNDDIAKMILKMIKNQEKKTVKKVIKKTASQKPLTNVQKKAAALAKKDKDVFIKSKGTKKTKTIGTNTKYYKSDYRADAKKADALLRKKRRPPEPPMAGVR
jgi:hypothetical protein